MKYYRKFWMEMAIVLCATYKVSSVNVKNVEIARVSDCSILIRSDWPIKKIDEIKHHVNNKRYVVARPKYCWESSTGYFLFFAESSDSKYRIIVYDTNRIYDIYTVRALPEVLGGDSHFVWFKLSDEKNFVILLLDIEKMAVTGVFKYSNSVLRNYTLLNDYALIFVTEYARGVTLNVKESDGIMTNYELATYVSALQPGRETRLSEKRRRF